MTKTSHALDLKAGIFALPSADAIARALKRAALQSHHRRSPPFRSAMSMLNFYINRAGRTLPAKRRKILVNAKQSLRRLFGRD